MAKIKREDIHIIGRYSNWSEMSIDKILKREINSSKKAWLKFLKLFFISLGVGFTIAGITFFFAYNWDNLHKFVKIGLIEAFIIVTIFIVLFSKLDLSIKNILFTGSSILVGVLFAVFGQIYQTGANAYDFFLGWTLFIALWVAVSNFPPLWLVFITLINTTLILYSQQVAHDWSEVFLFTILSIINVIFLMFSLFGKIIIKEIQTPLWFSNLLVLASVSFTTIGVIIGIYEEPQGSFFVLLMITSILYVVGIKYGVHIKLVFYFTTISFSVIVIVSAFLLKLSSDIGMLLFISLFIIGSITVVFMKLIEYKRKWTN